MDGVRPTIEAPNERLRGSTADRQQSLTREIDRVKQLVNRKVQDFRKEGILTDKLQRQAANFTAISEPLKQSIQDGHSKGQELAEFQQKNEELERRLRSRDLEYGRLRGNAGRRRHSVGSRADASPEHQPTRKDVRFLRTMPAFTILEEDVYRNPRDPRAHTRTRDHGADLRRLYEALEAPRTRIDIIPHDLRKDWELVAIAGLSNTPGEATSSEGKASAQQAAQCGGASGSRIFQLLQVNRSAFGESLEPTLPEDDPPRPALPRVSSPRSRRCTPHDRADRRREPRYHHSRRDERHRTIEDRRSRYRSLSPQPRGRTPIKDPRRQAHQLNPISPTKPPQNKRRRSRSPDLYPPRPTCGGKVVCKRCLRRQCLCSSEATCMSCEVDGRRCEYIRCGAGGGCRRVGCIFVHPGQLEGRRGEWVVVDD